MTPRGARVPGVPLRSANGISLKSHVIPYVNQSKHWNFLKLVSFHETLPKVCFFFTSLAKLFTKLFCSTVRPGVVNGYISSITLYGLIKSDDFIPDTSLFTRTTGTAYSYLFCGNAFLSESCSLEIFYGIVRKFSPGQGWPISFVILRIK